MVFHLGEANPKGAYCGMVSRAYDFFMHRRWVLRLMNTLHRSALRLSFGKLGWRAEGMPVLALTTTGRRSGVRHSCLLTSPLQQGNTYGNRRGPNLQTTLSRFGSSAWHRSYMLSDTARCTVSLSLRTKDRRTI